MKLSFANTSQGPSVNRLVLQLLFCFMIYVVCLFVQDIVENTYLSYHGLSWIYDFFLALLYVIPVFAVWQKEIKSFKIPVVRLLLILLVIPAVFNSFVCDDWSEISKVFVTAFYPSLAFLCLWPRATRIHSADLHEESGYVHVKTMIWDFAVFAFMPLLFIGLIVSYDRCCTLFSLYRLDVMFVPERIYSCAVFIVVSSCGWLLIWRRVFFANTLSVFHALKWFIISTLVACVISFLLFGSMAKRLASISVLFTFLFYVSSMLAFKRNSGQSQRYYLKAVKATDFEYTVYCPACHYNMSGSTKLRCPECGTEYVAGRLIEENVYLRNPDLWLN